MNKFGFLSFAGTVLALTVGLAGAASATPSFSFTNNAPVSFTKTAGVYQFTAVPVTVEDSSTLDGTGTLSGSGTASDYDVTLTEGVNTFDVITNGVYSYVGSPFFSVASVDGEGDFTATLGVAGNKLSGTYSPAPAPEAGSFVALGAMLLAGGLVLAFKRRSTSTIA